MLNAGQTEKLPFTVAWLGYGGLIPFVFLALLTRIDENHSLIWRDALFAYAAVILSFVGALHWAFAITLRELSSKQQNVLYIWSVVPAIIAWLALLLPLKIASLLLVAGFAAHYYQDSRLVKYAALPGWYLPLRLRLTLVAILCVAVGGF